MIIDHSTGSIVFLQIHLGGDRNFCYLLGDRRSGEAAAIDPGFDAPGFAKIATEHGLTINHILVTHGHADHMEQAPALAQLTGAKIHAGLADGVADALALADNQTLSLGRSPIKAIATPGHSPGHFCFLFHGHLVTGDLLFCGKIGGTGSYFKGSSPEQQYASLKKIMQLPDEALVFPGHDYYGGPDKRPHSTIGYEKSNNPFLMTGNFTDFCHLKDNWAVYKKEHGIQ